MPSYTQLISGIARDGRAARVSIPDDWMQGRTTYGGLTAALCLDAALPLSGGKPVRSAQIAFVGPVGGDVVTVPTLLREGKNTAFVSVRLSTAEGVVAEAIFAFGAARDSQLSHIHLPAPQVRDPEAYGSFFGEEGKGPVFAQQFDMLQAGGPRPMSASDTPDVTLWLRHRDSATPMNATSLLALADAPPPAAMTMFTGPGRISSMTWMAEFLSEEIITEDRWFLARHTAQTVQDGYSSQAMQMWNKAGVPVMIGRQTIAVFL